MLYKYTLLPQVTKNIDQCDVIYFSHLPSVNNTLELKKNSVLFFVCLEN